MVDRIRQILGWKKSYAECASLINEEFGTNYSVEEFKDLCKAIKDGKAIKLSKGENSTSFKIISEKTNYEKGISKLEVQYNKPLSKEELEQLLGIDNKTSFIKMVWLKSSTTQKWCYSVLVTYVKQEEVLLNNFTEFLKTYQPNFKRESIPLEPKFEASHTLIVSLTDFHLDKLTLSESTLKEKISLYRSTMFNLVTKAYSAYGIKQIVFVIGNDFFHTDNFLNQTTGGTPQDVNTSWFNAYEEGFKLISWAINFLRDFAPVHVVNVLSNHSRTKDYYLAHALEVAFKEDSSITFDRSASHTKVYVSGNNFFGFHHGDTSVDKLPLYFASKYGKQWGLANNRNIFLGDKHHKKQYKFSLGNSEVEGIRINYLPSLSDTDKWHEYKGFDTAIRAGLVHVYHDTKGYVAEFEHRV